MLHKSALLKELCVASDDNQAFFAARFLGVDAQASAREPYRKRIVNLFFPARGFRKLSLREALQAIRNHRVPPRASRGSKKRNQ